MDFLFKFRDKLYTCRESTLKKFPDCTLANCIAICEVSPSRDEFIEIDRDGTYFGVILDYMEDQKSFRLSGFSRKEVKCIREEARFYCLEELLELCDGELEHVPDIENCSPSGARAMHVFYTHEDLANALESCRGFVILLSCENYLADEKANMFLDLLNKCTDRRQAKVFGFFKGTLDSLPDTSAAILYDATNSKISRWVQAADFNEFIMMEFIYAAITGVNLTIYKNVGHGNEMCKNEKK